MNPQAPRSYRYFDLVMVGFVVVLLCSNLIGPAKITEASLPLFGTISFSTAVLYFPFAYIFGDILTEVYGYARARRVIWIGFAALAFASAMAAMVVWLPPASFWGDQTAYQTVFGTTWRIVAASMMAYWAGGFINSYVLAKLKVWMGGRKFWARAIGSTIFGQGVDTCIFFPVAFWGSGLIPDAELPQIMATEYGLKVGIEIIALPLTYAVVRRLKRAEHEDHYDRGTDFSPFHLKA